MIVRLTIEIEMKSPVSDLFDPAIPITIFQVIQVIFMIISFLFENDVPVS